MDFLLAILLTVTLQPPFGEAEAQILGVPAARTIDVSVEVEGAPVAVLARITGLAGELDPVALVPRGPGTYGQVIRLTAWEDVSISFEYISGDGETTISSPSTLTALGLDLEAARPTVPVPAADEDSGIDPWVLVGVAAGLGAVVVLAATSGGLLESVRSRSLDWTYAATSGADLPDATEEPADQPAEERAEEPA